MTVFVSSTVTDFGPLRTDLREWLTGLGVDVRESEDPEFPVTLGVHSHEACLRAIEGSHLFVVLVGRRYGGLYKDTAQSITWREYDEAVRLKIPVLKVVLGDVNRDAQRLSRIEALGQRLRAAKELQFDPRLLPFIDQLRKATVDNWVHLNWDGSFVGLRRILLSRLRALFVTFQSRHGRVQEQAERFERVAAARAEIDALVAEAALSGPESSKAWFIDAVVRLAEIHRASLFQFEPGDRFNFAVYRKDGNLLRVVGRHAHADIRVRNREWRVGEGHVGLCAKKNEILVSGNLAHTGSWKERFRSDRSNYVSAIAVPMAGPRGEVAGVFIVTSDRPDQFQDATSAEALTAASLASMMALLRPFEEPSE